MNKKEKVSLGLVGASLLVAVGIMAPKLGTIPAPGGEMVLYPTASAEEQINFISWLDTQQIPYEARSNGVCIPRSAIEFVNLKARMLKEEGKDRDHFAWVDNAGPFEESARTQVTPEELQPADGAERR